MTEILMARLDELNAHITNTDDPHNATASQVTFTPAGAIAATTVQGALEELDTEKQPLDALLTALAALTTAANKIIYATGVDTVALADLTAFARTFLDDPDAPAVRTTLGAEASGTAAAAITAHEGAADPHPGYLTAAEGNAAYQPVDPELTALAGLTSAANKGIQFTGAGTAATFDLTAAGKALVAAANAAEQRTTLELGTAATATLGTGAGQVPTNADLTIAAAATQAEQEAGSSTTAYTSPGLQHFHPSAAKAWVQFTGTGTVTINGSYNVTSITDNGTGDYTVNFTTAFSATNYAMAGFARDADSTGDAFVSQANTDTYSTTAMRVRTKNSIDSSIDSALVSVLFFGDQ